MSDHPATPQSRPNPLLRKLTPRAASLLSPGLELTDKHRLSRLIETRPAARQGATAAAE